MHNPTMDRQKGCPCCTFLLDDLFLPPSLKSSDDDVIESSSMDLPMDPKAAVNLLMSRASLNITILVDSHGHAQLERDADENYTLEKQSSSQGSLQLMSITCAVEPKDWEDTLRYASKSTSILPALGVHPWYLEGLPNNWLEELEKLLLEHPSAIVGEIGLCKMARWVRQHPEGKAVALAIQREVFKKQFILAARLRRPVSVHCVNQHGVFVSVMKEIRDSAESDEDVSILFPPAIAMHSFTGTAHHVNELTKLEKTIVKGKPLFYFGFSHSVNFAMCTSDKSRRKAREAVRAVPSDRLLVESDVHASDDLLAGTAGAIAYVAWAREQELIAIASLSSQNGQHFLAMQH